ncbi:MAG: hypothetical protein V4722_03170 [Bacteroidota bacterium]
MKKVNVLTILLMYVTAISAQNVGIGNTDPKAKLDVTGNVRINDGTQGLGKVLTSDATGKGSWQTLNTTTTPAPNGVGFGAWGDCSTSNISSYNPVRDSNMAVGDYFGLCNSMSGNYAIIGASGKTVGVNASQGAAYIYFFNGTTWEQLQTLTASDGAANDFFGVSVSINGNFAIVGARGKTVGGNVSQGKVYFFVNNGSSWVQLGTGLTASDGTANDYLGFSVSISGNYAIAGAYNKTVSGHTNRGKAYIYNYNGSTWAQVGTGITASDGAVNDCFGFSVSISGNNAIVGAYGKDVGVYDAQGKAYIFTNLGGTWTQVGTGFTNNDGAAYDVFGYDVSIKSNYAIIGARNKASYSYTSQGAAYIYMYNGSNWVQVQKLTANDGAVEDFYGTRVAITGKYVIVGAARKMIGSKYQQGAAYIYQNINGMWRHVQKVTDPAGSDFDLFGYGLSIEGSRFLVGAHGVQSNTGIAFFGKIME